jgi:serine/threonine protein kinase
LFFCRKCANILIDDAGEVKIGDLGVAAQLAIGKTTCDSRAGSPHWMAPEVLDVNQEYDCRADIWSLGITAIEMAVGVPPSSNMEENQILVESSRNIARRPPPLLPSSGKWSENFHDFIHCCLIKNFRSRSSAEALLSVSFLLRFCFLIVV